MAATEDRALPKLAAVAPAPDRSAPAEAPAAELELPAAPGPLLAAARPSRLLLVALAGAAGLLATSAAFVLSRSNPGSGLAQILFWAGLGLIVLPSAWRLLAVDAARSERVGVLLVAGLLLYLVKVLHDPYGFTYADEWVHVYNVQQILHTGSLFSANPIIPITTRYPGLEAVTASLASIGHLSVFAAGAIVLGAARLVFILALFLFLERITGSARIAGIAVIVYATNPNFLFWSAEFSYESLALPLALLALLATAKALAPRSAPDSATAARVAWTAVALLATTATVMSHHLTSYALCVFLVAACVIAGARASTRAQAPWLLAGFAVTVTALWVSTVAPGTGRYLLPVIGRAYHESVATLLGHSSTRSLFGGGAGAQSAAPVWQRLAALSSVGLVVLALPLGLLQVRRRFRLSPFVHVLAAAAVLYVAVLPMRLVPAAWETSNRSSEFLFLGVALCLALIRPRRSAARRLRRTGGCSCLALLLVGGIVAGWPPRVLLALPSRARAAGGSEIVPQPQATAEWARSVLGPGHRFIAPEAIGRELLVNGGQLAWVTSAPFDAASVLFDDNVTSGIVDALTSHHVGYVVEDTLASGDDSMAGYFFRSALPATPADPVAVGKFDSFPGIDRVFDSGQIAIYDVGAFSGSP